MNAIKLALLCAPLAGALAARAVVAAPPVPVAELIPFASRVEEVFAGASVEGRAVTTLRFNAPGAPQQVLRNARDAWARRGVLETVTARTADWHLLSARVGESYWTLQVRHGADNGNASVGLISVWHEMERSLRDAARAHPPGSEAAAVGHALLPPTAVVLRTVASVDGRRSGTTVVAVVPSGREWVSQAVQAFATVAGFERSHPPAAPSGKNAGEVLFLRRGTSEVAVTLVDGQGGTAVVMHTHEERR